MLVHGADLILHGAATKSGAALNPKLALGRWGSAGLPEALRRAMLRLTAAE
jgi:hypothetical protein